MKKQTDEPKLPASNLMLAALQARIRFRDRVYLSFLAVLLVLFGIEKYDKLQLRDQLKNAEAFLVPSVILDWIRLRPNSLDDEVVFEFVDYYLENIGNWDFESVESKYQKLKKYMSPEMQTQTDIELRKKLSYWQANKISHRVKFQPANKVERTTSERKTTYTAVVWATVTEYLDGREQRPYREKITLSMRTGVLDNSKSWFFEVTDLVRETEQDIKDKETISKLRSSENT